MATSCSDKILLKAKDEHFAIDKVQCLHRLSKALRIFGARREHKMGTGLVPCRRLSRGALLRIVLRVQTQVSPPAQVIDREVAGDGEKPRFKARSSVVGTAALKNAKPGFLYQVIHLIAPSQQVYEIADKTILVLLHQGVEEEDIACAKTTCNLLRIAIQSRRQCPIVFGHTWGIRIKHTQITQAPGINSKEPGISGKKTPEPILAGCRTGPAALREWWRRRAFRWASAILSGMRAIH